MEEEISFEDLGLDEVTLAAVERKGFVSPSPVQVLAIPRLLNGDANVIARARTGTGKTAAFGLPLVQKLRNESGTVKAVILEPTRELAMQTCTEMASFTTGRFPRTAVVYGGASIGMQIKDIKRGVEIVVGTPGRVQDLIDRGVLDISKIEYFILDEGDEMLDMGFIDDIEKIFSSANPESRVLLFSATMPAPILKIASEFMGDYEIVEEEGHEEEPLLIDQKYWVVKETEKVEALIRLIDISPDFYGLVFVQKKTDADYVSKQLDEKGYEVAALHGDIPQGQREKILARFRSGKTRVLVATDVAARGIDIEGLTHVVNYSLPFDGPTYVHRIGRTGRAGAAGMAVTFVCPNERRRLGYMRNAIRKSAKGELEEDKVPGVREVLEAKESRLFNQIKQKLFVTPEISEDENKKSPEKKSGTDENICVSENADGIPTVEKNLTDEDKKSAAGEKNNSAEEKNISDSENNISSAENAPDENMTDDIESVSDTAASSETEEKSLPGVSLVQCDSVFDRMAEELCSGQNPQQVVASLLSLTYGEALKRSRYGRITSYGSKEGEGRGGKDSRGEGRSRSRGSVQLKDNQIRLYVQLGWHDKMNPKSIAEFFSKLLHIPGRLVDDIDMADKFCLLSLPSDAGKKALELSEKDRSLPHMHQDIRNGGVPLQEGQESTSRKPERSFKKGGDKFRGEREGKFSADKKAFGSKKKNFDSGKDRYAVAKKDDDRRRSDKNRTGKKSSKGAKGGSHARAGVHTPTERNGSAGLYKKKSSGAAEY